MGDIKKNRFTFFESIAILAIFFVAIIAERLIFYLLFGGFND